MECGTRFTRRDNGEEGRKTPRGKRERATKGKVRHTICAGCCGGGPGICARRERDREERRARERASEQVRESKQREEERDTEEECGTRFALAAVEEVLDVARSLSF